jgi:hypothetical protein
LISGKKKENSDEVLKNSDIPEQDIQFNFSFRNYVKESFSVLIVNPLSGYVMKTVRVASLLIAGVMAGTLAATLCFIVFMQFEPVENTVLSSFLREKIEKSLPNSDFSMKSAALHWDLKAGAMEIALSKVRIDDFLIPKISVLLDYKKSFDQQRPVVKSVSILSPKLNLNVEDDFKKISINPNFEKGGANKALFEPLSTLGNFERILDKNAVIKLINADVSISEGGINWNLNNLYCEYKAGENFPKIIDCSVSIPEQRYTSHISLGKSDTADGKSVCNVKIESLNPSLLSAALSKRNTPPDSRIFSVTDGYNLPVSGTLKLDFKDAKFLGGKFDLTGTNGSVKLPTKSIISLNLGKKIDNGSVSGSFSEKGAVIDSLNVSYENSDLQLTGIKIPLGEFKFLDVANIDGTLSLTNIDAREMEAVLPDCITKSAIAVLKNYLPTFRMELFKVDVKGSVAFGNRPAGDTLKIGHGIFKIKDAKIPLGNRIVTNVDASGTISEDGLDVRLSNALFGKAKINRGVFFVSNADNSWIGKVNVTVPIANIAAYVPNISAKLASLPLEKLNLKGYANLDMKLLRVEGDELPRKDSLPFRIVEGEGEIKSDGNTKDLRLSWNGEKLSLVGNMVTGQNEISLKLNENLKNNSGNRELVFASNSDFLEASIPGITKMCNGDYILKINSSWKNKQEEHDVSMDLKNATMNIPLIGDVKLSKENGTFTARVLDDGKGLEFSKMALDTPNCKIKGKMTLDKNGKLTKCSLDSFENGGNSAKINLLKEKDRISFSAVGDYIDVSKVFSMLDKTEKDVVVSAYVNLKEAAITNNQKIRNVKGTLDWKNGKIINGACFGVLGKDTTLALSAKEMEGSDDALLALSASNAGEFLREFKITDTVSGGSINFITKSSKNIGKSFSGAFEMSDFIVKNNNQLTKLISLSSTNCLPNTDNLSVGFNLCTGNFTVTEDRITLEGGKAISPTVAISYRGSYDRANDNFDVSGMSLPMSAFLSNTNPNGSLTASYGITGSLGVPVLSVRPLRFVNNDALNEIFGNMLPVMVSAENDGMDIIPAENLSIAPQAGTADPFSHGAFDKKAENTVNTINTEAQGEKKLPSKNIVKDKFGIKITRGVKDTAPPKKTDTAEK